MHELAFVIAGFVVGAIVGFTGVGGGSLMTPILIFLFGVKPYLAVGTDLLFAAFTKLGGTIKLARAKVIDWPIVLNLSAGSIPASLITLYVLHSADAASQPVQKFMTTALGLALLLTAAATLYKTRVIRLSGVCAMTRSNGSSNTRSKKRTKSTSNRST